MLLTRYRRMGSLALVAGTTICASCPPPALRPGPAFDGSAYWAWQIAEPQTTAFAPDSHLYEVLGAVVYHDGRLPGNTGTWSFVTWSASRQQVFQVTVDHAGVTTTSTRSQATAPGSGGQPVPAGWVNSPVIFQAAEPHRPGSAVTAQLAVFNLGTWATGGQWGINYPGGPNVIVRWDGTFVGTQ